MYIFKQFLCQNRDRRWYPFTQILQPCVLQLSSPLYSPYVILSCLCFFFGQICRDKALLEAIGGMG
jgi:hypothetical protein